VVFKPEAGFGGKTTYHGGGFMAVFAAGCSKASVFQVSVAGSQYTASSPSKTAVILLAPTCYNNLKNCDASRRKDDSGFQPGVTR
jgi:hypothetical protein